MRISVMRHVVGKRDQGQNQSQKQRTRVSVPHVGVASLRADSRGGCLHMRRAWPEISSRSTAGTACSSARDGSPRCPPCGLKPVLHLLRRALLVPARVVFPFSKNFTELLLEALPLCCGWRGSRLLGLGFCIGLHFGSGSCTSSHFLPPRDWFEILVACTYR